MRNLYVLLLLFFSVINPLSLDAQKTYKAVCDKSDGRVKIVESEDRSPDMVPLKGGFPFYQVARNWVEQNYPDGSCDPDLATRKNQEAADEMTQQAANNQNQAAGNQSKQVANNNSGFKTQTAPSLTAFRPANFHNTSVVVSFLFSSLGKVYNLDPPMIPGASIGIEQLFGSKTYGGTGIHLVTLIGKTDDDNDEISAFYTLRIPLFAGYRKFNGTHFWGIDMGLAVNTMLKPLTTDSGLAGETASDFSLNTITRVRVGGEQTTFEIGIDAWLNEILSSEHGFQMTMISLGYRYAF